VVAIAVPRDLIKGLEFCEGLLEDGEVFRKFEYVIEMPDPSRLALARRI
jgi:hypothetical protein